jgi:hypothetical protein
LKGKHLGHSPLLFIGTYAPKYAIICKFQYTFGTQPLPVSQKVKAMAKRLLTPEIKDGIIEAFEQVGGVDYLVELAKVDPPTFCRLLAAIIPSEIKADIRTTHTFDLGQAMLEGNQRLAAIENKE